MTLTVSVCALLCLWMLIFAAISVDGAGNLDIPQPERHMRVYCVLHPQGTTSLEVGVYAVIVLHAQGAVVSRRPLSKSRHIRALLGVSAGDGGEARDRLLPKMM